MSKDEDGTQDGPTFTGQEAAYAQKALRGVMGLPVEAFSLQAFVGMISDEIEQLRSHGFSDAAIAELISEITGKVVAAGAITSFYADSQSRGHRKE